MRRSIPPDPLTARFSTDRVFRAHNREVRQNGVRVLASRIHITTGAVRANEMFATTTSAQDEAGVPFCSGFAHRRNILPDAPAYVQEAAALHSLRVLREWITQRGQSVLQYINSQAGDEAVRAQLALRFPIGR